MTATRHHRPAGFLPSFHAVDTDGFVFLTGPFPRDLDAPDAPFPDGIAAETSRTLGNLARALGALGLGLEHLASVHVCLTAFERDWSVMGALSFTHHALTDCVVV